MSVVKYRGKVDGVWWHVSPDHNPNLFGQFWHVVDRNTVGQFTGIIDRFSQEIFEGDVICRKNIRFIYQVIWSETHARFSLMSLFLIPGGIHGYCALASLKAKADRNEVIGNVYDNPEFLQEAGNA